MGVGPETFSVDVSVQTLLVPLICTSTLIVAEPEEMPVAGAMYGEVVSVLVVDEQGSFPGAQTAAIEGFKDLKMTLSTLPPVTPLTVAVKDVLFPIATVAEEGVTLTLQDFPGGFVGVGGIGVLVGGLVGPGDGVEEITPAPQQVAGLQLVGIALSQLP